MSISKSAIVRDGQVINVIVGSIPDSIACPPDVAIGWQYDDERFTPPSPTVADMNDVRANLRAAIEDAVARVRSLDRLRHGGADWEVTERAEHLVQRKAARIAAGGTPATVTLYDVSGTRNTLDHTAFAALVGAADDWLDALYTAAAVLQSAVGDLDHADATELQDSLRSVGTLDGLQALARA